MEPNKEAKLSAPLTYLADRVTPLDITQYRAEGGYLGAQKALNDYSSQQALELVKQSELKGRGGAGFPTGLKWSFVPDKPAKSAKTKSKHSENGALNHRYLVCNADEMEPGTFKDRWLLEGIPHLLVESMIIAAYAIGADKGFIFLRGEYQISEKRLHQAINEALSSGWLGSNIKGSGFSFELHLHTSAGRYICGEETALINALEGKRANPRAKPPFPQVAGLFGQPTIVNNVETLCNLAGIFRHGSEWFKGLSPGSDAGTKIYGACGNVVTPGLWELPMGVSVGKLLNEYAGGVGTGKTLKGLLPGGASTDFLLPEHLDVPMDYDSIANAGSRLGTGGLIVLDNEHCPVAMVLNLLMFFAQESCGWCTPCRDGTPWAVQLLQKIESGDGCSTDIDQLLQLCDFMWIGKTHCALAPGAVEPLRSALNYFMDDFQAHLDKKCCPYRSEL